MNEVFNLTAEEIRDAMGDQMNLVTADKRYTRLYLSKKQTYESCSAEYEQNDKRMLRRRRLWIDIPTVILFLLLFGDSTRIFSLVILCPISALAIIRKEAVQEKLQKWEDKKSYGDTRKGKELLQFLAKDKADYEAARKDMNDNRAKIHSGTPFIPIKYCNAESYLLMYEYISNYRAVDVTSLINLYEQEQHRRLSEQKLESIRRTNEETQNELNALRGEVNTAAMVNYLHRITK